MDRLEKQNGVQEDQFRGYYRRVELLKPELRQWEGNENTYM